jgi:hypothetical protein
VTGGSPRDREKEFVILVAVATVREEQQGSNDEPGK